LRSDTSYPHFFLTVKFSLSSTANGYGTHHQNLENVAKKKSQKHCSSQTWCHMVSSYSSCIVTVLDPMGGDSSQVILSIQNVFEVLSQVTHDVLGISNKHSFVFICFICIYLHLFPTHDYMINID
jgi:hypothetical protein